MIARLAPFLSDVACPGCGSSVGIPCGRPPLYSSRVCPERWQALRLRLSSGRELTFLRFWRALNAMNDTVGLPDVPLGRTWRLFVDAFGGAG